MYTKTRLLRNTSLLTDTNYFVSEIKILSNLFWTSENTNTIHYSKRPISRIPKRIFELHTFTPFFHLDHTDFPPNTVFEKPTIYTESATIENVKPFRRQSSNQSTKNGTRPRGQVVPTSSFRLLFHGFFFKFQMRVRPGPVPLSVPCGKAPKTRGSNLFFSFNTTAYGVRVRAAPTAVA